MIQQEYTHLPLQSGYHFKLSNENSSRIVYNVDLIYNTISEQNHLNWAVGSKIIIDQFHTTLFFPPITYILSYVFSCKHTMSYFLRLTVQSGGVTQLGCDMELCMVSLASLMSVSLACFLLMLMLPGESPVFDIVHLSVASRLRCS